MSGNGTLLATEQSVKILVSHGVSVDVGSILTHGTRVFHSKG